MWIEYSVAAAVVIFGVTCFFLIRTLLQVQKTLASLQTRIEVLSEESLSAIASTSSRIKSLDPILNSIFNIGEICEFKTGEMKGKFLSAHHEEERSELPRQLVEWAVLSAQLGQQFFKRR